ncbi:EamA family transporter [Ramlibacter rhizophilus]|uniref:EamA family transporter n=1 Tax=Ramlibacter rhizophilus TaxID=1781167 RepID=A0A4Z0BFF2_9BURK|nr:EamA family transporter [Ramlibacter rhizophilus]TFY97411.1 EamA family transporter [Ramlibacter rhizophilus]
MTSSEPLRPIDLLAIAAVVLIWGLNFVVMKFGLQYFTPFQLGAGRFAFACLPLLLFIRPPAVRARWLIAFGLTQGVGQFGALFLALQVGMTAALASVLMQTQVFFTALFGVLLLRERIGGPLKAGMAFAAVGLSCFAAQILMAQGAGAVTAWGLALNLLAAALWAASNILVRQAQREAVHFDPLAFVVWGSAVAPLPFLALSLLVDPPGARANWVAAPWAAWAALAVLGWLATTLAYGAWAALLRRYPASRVAPFSLAVPLVGLSAGVLLLGEQVTALQWIGAAFVLGALLSVLFGARLGALVADPARARRWGE